ncbi:MAG: hypothetical protein QW523_05380 [Nitrososphaerota archaeon]
MNQEKVWDAVVFFNIIRPKRKKRKRTSDKIVEFRKEVRPAD